MAEYTASIVSYFDILGFRKLVALSPSPESVASKLRALARFSSPDNDVAERFGTTFTNFSDLVVRTVPIRHDPNYGDGEGLLYWELLDLVHAQAELIREGVLLRGGITIGNMFVDGGITFGPALIRAYELESSVAITPRVILDPVVFSCLEQYRGLRAHEAVEDDVQYIRRLIKKDNDGVWFIDYLRAMGFEANNEETYLRFLTEHKELIVATLTEVKGLDSVTTKYGWLREYHNAWINSLNDKALENMKTSKEKLLVPEDLTQALPSILEDPDANI